MRCSRYLATKYFKEGKAGIKLGNFNNYQKLDHLNVKPFFATSLIRKALLLEKKVSKNNNYFVHRITK